MNRLPPVAGFLWAVASIALAAALCAGARAVPGWDPFVLHEVRVEGAEATTAEAVIRVAGIETGVGLFAVDVAAVRRAVSSLPWVRQTRVVRQLPGTLRIAVTEWQPAFLARLDELRYVTAEGHVVQAPLARGLDYPVITGVDRAALEGEGRPRRALLEWVELSRRDVLGAEVSEIHLSEVTGMSLYTADGVGLQLGWSGFEEKLDRLGRLRKHLKGRNQSAYVVNLSYTDRIIARLAPVNARKHRP
jgi:cell division protein FtsQ